MISAYLDQSKSCCRHHWFLQAPISPLLARVHHPTQPLLRRYRELTQLPFWHRRQARTSGHGMPNHSSPSSTSSDHHQKRVNLNFSRRISCSAQYSSIFRAAHFAASINQAHSLGMPTTGVSTPFIAPAPSASYREGPTPPTTSLVCARLRGVSGAGTRAHGP